MPKVAEVVVDTEVVEAMQVPADMQVLDQAAKVLAQVPLARALVPMAHTKVLHLKALIPLPAGSHFGAAVMAVATPRVAIKKRTKTASNEERYSKPRRSDERV